MAFNSDKLKSLVHYIIWNVSDPAKLGSTKLHKVLWFSDARAYVLHGESITGESYVRREHGPIAQHFMKVRKALEDDGAIRVSRQPIYNRDQDIYVALWEPRKVALKREQQQIVDYFIRYVTEEHTAKSISEESHDYGWEIAQMGETLPYFAILASRAREPKGSELDWARGVAKELSLP